MLISCYLAESKNMLCMYGYDDNTDITVDERSFTISPYYSLVNLTWHNQFSIACIHTSGF